MQNRGSLNDPAALMKGLVAAWIAGDASGAAAHFTENATYQEAGHAPITGRPAIAAHFAHFFSGTRQWRFDLDETVVQNERAALCYRFAIEGESGSWRERAGCAYMRLCNGLIALWREYEG